MGAENRVMRIDRIERAEIGRNWPWVEQLIGPVIRSSGGDPLDVKYALIDGGMALLTLHADSAAGLVIIEPGIFDHVFALWVPYVVGRVKSGPKAFAAIIRELMARLEEQAQIAGCADVRIGGRNYAPILGPVGYQRFDDQPNRLRKVLR